MRARVPVWRWRRLNGGKERKPCEQLTQVARTVKLGGGCLHQQRRRRHHHRLAHRGRFLLYRPQLRVPPTDWFAQPSCCVLLLLSRLLLEQTSRLLSLPLRPLRPDPVRDGAVRTCQRGESEAQPPWKRGSLGRPSPCPQPSALHRKAARWLLTRGGRLRPCLTQWSEPALP